MATLLCAGGLVVVARANLPQRLWRDGEAEGRETRVEKGMFEPPVERQRPPKPKVKKEVPVVDKLMPDEWTGFQKRLNRGKKERKRETLEDQYRRAQEAKSLLRLKVQLKPEATREQHLEVEEEAAFEEQGRVEHIVFGDGGRAFRHAFWDEGSP